MKGNVDEMLETKKGVAYSIELMHMNLHKDADDLGMTFEDLVSALNAHGDFTPQEHNQLIAMHKSECEVVVEEKSSPPKGSMAKPSVRFKHLGEKDTVNGVVDLGWKWEVTNGVAVMQGSSSTLERAKAATEGIISRWSK